MKITFDEGSVWQRDPALPFQMMGDETIVVDPATRQVHLLNATATRIWELLAAAQPLRELVAVLEEEFEAPSTALRAEIEAFLSEMKDRRLCAPQSVER